MRHIFLTLILVLATVCGAHAFVDSYTIDRDKLPAEAQKMLTEHFPKAKIGMDIKRSIASLKDESK